MSDTFREQKATDAFIALTEALMKDYDIVELLSTLSNLCTEILAVQACGILLVNAGDLELVASTSEEAKVVETIIIAAGVGPCIDCFTSGVPVIVPDIALDANRWPAFEAIALEQGFRSTYALPMRLRDQVVGVMNLLSTAPGALSDKDGDLAQSLADIAVLGILHERNFREPNAITEQLHSALDTRILIEQAKGVLVHEQGLSMAESFNALRNYARMNNVNLRDVADGTVRRTIVTSTVVAHYIRSSDSSQ